MLRTGLLYAVPVLLALIAGPAGYVLSSMSRPDTSHIYLIVGADNDLSAVLANVSIREVSPYRAPFARMVQIPPDLHRILVGGDYWILPAGTIAEFCGFTTENQV